MDSVLEQSVLESKPAGVNRLAHRAVASPPAHREAAQRVACFHCGEPCLDLTLAKASKVFCCQGCLFVHDLLTESGLNQFYDLTDYPGVRAAAATTRRDWTFLDDPSLQAKFLDFTDGKTSRVTFHIPAIHCVACVWLLENLFRLLPGIGRSQVDFSRREVAISFAANQVSLSRLVALLFSIGYEPELNYGQLDKPQRNSTQKKLWLQIGLAGFVFGNVMLFSLPVYLGLDHFSGPAFRTLFGYLSLVLTLPVLLFSASDYWRSAWLSIRQRRLTLEVPIALGLFALYAQTVFEVVSGRGDGYADSLAGLVFFLLCGRAFQQKTHERLAFDRDYKSFFPLSVTRKNGGLEESIALANLKVGDRILLRNGELIPADSTLLSGGALVDYSFVTGESEPVKKHVGEHLYAGGQQLGAAIEVQTVKPVSQSYLTSLWNLETFQKPRGNNLNTLTNRYSRRFTKIVIAVACVAGLYWTISGNAGRGLKAFASVLIVACPCALALAAPFALGTAQRLLGSIQVYLKNILVLERLAEADTIVFDKTGTLTTSQSSQVTFFPTTAVRPDTSSSSAALSASEQACVHTIAAQSVHPNACQIADSLLVGETQLTVSGLVEITGAGLEGTAGGCKILLGSRGWLVSHRIKVPALELSSGSVSYLAIDGEFRGAFVLSNALRPRMENLFAKLGKSYEVVLLSGDNERERCRFEALFEGKGRLHFNQSPIDKLAFVRKLQDSGKTVMMVGDGLNDAGALKQSDVGVAVVERVGVFSPASDIIMEAAQVSRLVDLLGFAKSSTRIVRASFGVSAVYNLAGISIAAAGILSPLICAVLMPLSSISVALFACGMTTWAARRSRLSSSSPDRHNH